MDVGVYPQQTLQEPQQQQGFPDRGFGTLDYSTFGTLDYSRFGTLDYSSFGTLNYSLLYWYPRLLL